MNSRVFNYLNAAWILFVLVFLTIIIHLTVKSNNEKIKGMAESFFDEIVITRAWAAMHGGVYVFVNDYTPPNPYLKVPNRDIYTTDSMMLTLVNPSYMTRQIGELAEEHNNNINYHLTSNNPIRELNAADEWETNALNSFENGVKYAFDKSMYHGEEHYRYMAPLLVEHTCMKCHAEQGYHVGDIRGGISVNITSLSHKKQLNIELSSLAIIHLVLLIIGLLGISFARSVINKQFKYTKLKSQQLALHKSRLSKSNKQLEELNSQQEKFLSIIAHDLRNPVGAIMGLSEILVEEEETLDKNGRMKIATNLHSSAVNTFNLMENLLSWSRSKQGKMDYNPIKLFLEEEVQKACIFINESMPTKGIEINTQFDDKDKTEIWVDKDILSTILRNLLTNAIKFTEENGTINIHAKTTDTNHIKITIQDTGIGMSEEKVKDLFSIDKSKSTPGTNNEKGTGLGLILVKEFVELNKGKLSVLSQVNKGTSITFTVPLMG